MNTLAQMKAQVAGYHNVATAALTVNGIDLFLAAVNNAQKEGQMLHDFEECRCAVTLDIDAVVGGDLKNVVFENNATQRTVTVTGSATPAIVGTYQPANVLFNGFPLYVFYGNPSFFLFYDTGVASYLISDTLQTTTPTNYITPAAGISTPAGIYDTIVGTFTGMVTVAQDTAGLFSGIREVLAVTRQRPDGTYIPIDFARADIPIERDRTELEFSDNLFPYLRYPSDAQINARGTNSSVIQRGTNLSIYPKYTAGVTTPFNVRLECFGWLQDFDASDLLDALPTNFLVDYGYTWLQWYAICETNYSFKTFVQRTEGNLAPPEKMRDDAWQKLILFDSYRVDSNTTRSR